MRCALSLLLILAATPLAYGQTVWYVDDDSDAEHGCTSWEDACPELQTALSLAEPGDQIWVAVGTYKPDYDIATGKHTGDREATFQLIDGVELYGGFDGTESSLEERAELFNQTMLSGDLPGDDAPYDSDCCYAHAGTGCDDSSCEAEVCAVQPLCCENGWEPFCVFMARVHCADTCGGGSNNSYHVTSGSGTDESARLDGFAVLAGNANRSPSDTFGGGLYISVGSPKIDNCVFSGNRASLRGGGMYAGAGAPVVTNCTFVRNIAELGGGLYVEGVTSQVSNCVLENNSALTSGGGMFNLSSDLSVTDCIFRENVGGAGGGMVNSQEGDCVVSNCMFFGNAAVRHLGGWGGGGMANTSNPEVVNCWFIGNTAANGGGMLNAYASPIVADCLFAENSATNSCGGGMCNDFNSHPIVTNCAFNRNTSVSGGGVCNSGASSTMLHCSFLGNVGSWGGGIFNYGSSAQLVAGCAFVGNIADVGGGIFSMYLSDVTVTNSTFSLNGAGSGTALGFGAVGQEDPSRLRMTNCILWDGGNEVWNEDDSLIEIAFSDVQGGWPGIGNVNADPLFVQSPHPGPDGEWGTEDDDYGDLRLQPGSPCIDAADNSAVPADVTDVDEDGDTNEPIPWDLEGDPRFVDDPVTADCAQAPGQCGECPVVDMGAYEFQDGNAHCCPADFDGDGAVGAADLAELLGSWGPCEGCPADLDDDGNVGPFDLALLLGAWGPCQ